VYHLSSGTNSDEFSWVKVFICIGIVLIVFFILYVLFSKKNPEKKITVKERVEAKIIPVPKKRNVKNFFDAIWEVIRNVGKGVWAVLGIVIVLLCLTKWGTITHWFEKEEVTYIVDHPTSSMRYEPLPPKVPQRHLLQFGENHMKPGEIWYFVGDKNRRHYRCKENDSPIVTIYPETEGWYQRFQLNTIDGEEQPPAVFDRHGKIYCSYTQLVTVDREVTIIVTKVQ
jgi:hypothetical protein